MVVQAACMQVQAACMQMQAACMQVQAAGMQVQAAYMQLQAACMQACRWKLLAKDGYDPPFVRNARYPNYSVVPNTLT